MRVERIDNIIEFVYKNKNVTLDQICDNFNISKSTVRRDLSEILKDSNLQKTYGGITLKNKLDNRKYLTSFNERNIENIDKKLAISKKAATIVEDNDIIFIDSGTTTFYMADYLDKINNLTILTNNLEVIFRAAKYKNINLISLSGTLNRETLSFVGTTSISTIKKFNMSKAFMATTGFSILNGVTNSSPLEFDIKRTVISKSSKIILLADSSKFNSVSLMTYCDLEDIDILITDKMPDKEIKDYLFNKKISIEIA
ncbi:DeoR/GlpR transcriptional regulator [Brachyspira aalborgi]|jgi:D binding transcriptional repressor|uniref:DeoR/GlpR transcriptional regulator n=1 Tax=Brachyspira aalborgi TaxID=29522 RepID=A0A5C8FRG6_9SPIR|nr:DeoR/GlpR family DNA-binding transcription regulator [Brachyspira aalborgi]TXJ38504.1 DeoR/GlpR transcriptional regulator [Brachyspira aalborgi]TXJ52206.1 DeoR/GlpR transcriptional regulator [Brachyspira aalborgi]